MPDAAQTHEREFAFRDVRMIAVIALCVLFLVVYTADYLVMRIRVAAHGAAGPTESVTYFYAAPVKGDKVHVFSDQPQTETCVRSIFPWLGHDPCWYAKRHAIKVES
jgi:hypothetical protein